MKIMTRQEVLALFPSLVLPESVSSAFAAAGIMTKNVTVDKASNVTVTYAWQMETFAGMPDGVLTALYAEARHFVTDYDERKRYLAEEKGEASPLHLTEVSAMYELQRTLHLFPPPIQLTTKDTLEKYATAFARHFLYQWRRYQ